MKVSITKEELSKALSIVSKGMSSRSTLPILSGILLSTTDKELIFQTTDLEISIKCFATAFIEEQGSVVIPGKLFNDIVKSLPDAAVQLSTESEKFKIECLNSLFTLNTLNVGDFPHFPEIKTNQSITLPATQLSNMVRQVSKVVSKDESRAVLTGILFSLEDETLQLVATDSYRLAISKAKLENPTGATIEIIIPGRTFEEVSKSAAFEDVITLGISENQILFEFGSTLFITRKIEGNYPNYKQLIPSEKNTTVSVKTSELISAVKRVALLAQTHTPIKFTFSSEDQNIEILSQSQEIGGAVEFIQAEVIGEDKVEIGFNHQYIIDGLSSIDSDETVIEVQTSLKPGIFKSKGNHEFLYLAMPVRLG